MSKINVIQSSVYKSSFDECNECNHDIANDVVCDDVFDEDEVHADDEDDDKLE